MWLQAYDVASADFAQHDWHYAVRTITPVVAPNRSAVIGRLKPATCPRLAARPV
jgi:hypothetical protein